ncbi:sensor histidine kinase [Glycomyces xiaoerkulensis]|uniref:sensor histidine kinase n=1 Tax=Glycomyces xiaoerkulensis TaxID=2038139 RepID=UPI000C267318|nr:HAMP domain-containing sensor histidine kinase [Glycomyces xiaoerkulensis]
MRDFADALGNRWERVPLRVRLTAAVLALVAGSLLIISVSTILALHSTFLGTIDQELKDKFETLGLDEVAALSDSEGSSQLGIRPNQYIFSMLNYPDRRHDLPQSQTDAPNFTLADIEAHPEDAFTALAADGSVRWRVYAVSGEHLRQTIQENQEGLDPAQQIDSAPSFSDYYALSYNLKHFDRTVAGLVWVDVLIGVGVLAGLAALGFGLVRASLAPLRQIENTAAMIAAGNYSQRVPPRDPETEVGRVSMAINSMLGKIESSIRAREYSEGRAHDSERRMREFIADASHELRTPLTNVRGYSELVRANPGMPENERQHYIGQIEEAAKRMGLLVGDLLHLARLDQERPVETEPVDLALLGHEAVSSHSVVAEDYRFEFESVPGAPTVVVADRARMRQVIDNLLSNAVRHTPPGTTVTVAVAAEDDEVVLRVADDGPGMESEVADRVFERFFRSDGVTHPGSGLGLAIVAAIVRSHGGSVSVRSEPGGGTEFTVRLDAESQED